MMMKKFLQDEFWLLSIQGAFQRAGCYKSQATENDKAEFKTTLRDYIDKYILPMYSVEFEKVEEELHQKNILQLVGASKRHADILVNGSINIGISQKLINLYLKYNWCAGYINEPPHFPVDRIIQIKLKIKDIKPWTKFTDIQDYLDVIQIGKEYLNKHPEFKSLANMELSIFNRR